MTNPIHFRDARCPYCNALNDAHMNTDDGDNTPPEAGDISICFSCAKVLIYTDTGQRKPSPEELSELMQEPNIVKAQMSVLESVETREAIAKAADPEWVASDLIEEYP